MEKNKPLIFFLCNQQDYGCSHPDQLMKKKVHDYQQTTLHYCLKISLSKEQGLEQQELQKAVSIYALILNMIDFQH